MVEDGKAEAQRRSMQGTDRDNIEELLRPYASRWRPTARGCMNQPKPWARSTSALNQRNQPRGRIRHQNRAMRIPSRPAIVSLFCGLALCVGFGQSRQDEPSGNQWPRSNASYGRRSERTLSEDDGLAVIAAALDPKVRRYSGRDCSHLVHAIYERAGFPYAYADSSDLYAGIEGFQKVSRPQPGDLVVWRGHVGIVVRPSRHVFFSFLRGGPGVDDYQAPYWASRGRPRFYRYVKQ